MNYTIKIAENDKESRKIIMMIKDLAVESPFISIHEDETGLSGEMEEELEKRFIHVLKNPAEGKSWAETKADFLDR